MSKAIIETGGMQFPVSEGHTIDVPRIDGKVGDTVVFDRVLYADRGEEKLVGSPTVPDAKIEGEIIAQERDEKITVFRFKRRTKYRRTTGHRQHYTRVRITSMAL